MNGPTLQAENVTTPVTYDSFGGTLSNLRQEGRAKSNCLELLAIQKLTARLRALVMWFSMAVMAELRSRARMASIISI